MFKHMGGIHKVEGPLDKREDGGFAYDQFCSSRDDQCIATSLPPVSNIPFQEVGHADKRIVSWANLQDTTREIGSSPPG